jgi:hypothetical protein
MFGYVSTVPGIGVGTGLFVVWTKRMPGPDRFDPPGPFHYKILNDIKDHSKSSRSRKGANIVTSNHDDEAHGCSESVFYSLI